MLGNTRRQHSPPPGVYSSLSTTEVEEPWRRRQRESQDRDAREVNSDVLTKTQAYCLYASHTLSMWDSRMYEFAVVSCANHLFHKLWDKSPKPLCG